MAEIEIIIKVKPPEFDLIVDALTFHRATIKDELNSPIADPDFDLRSLHQKHLDDIDDLIEAIA